MGEQYNGSVIRINDFKGILADSEWAFLPLLLTKYKESMLAKTDVVLVAFSSMLH